ncbi:glutathione S-transferase [Polynucleobacter sp. AP-Nino-20-G2]|uniref:glutathione S-transferase n=1 Tax=Polynucleobacter sp. AP-Nino-20-G2 TaxID=2576917 RepID=UPI001BFE59B5|nr:glutathione S-transferase [Polynucleobacter sp. AP-Nino-20-G2]QWE17454.1 glutathione S-transferase [Polynucleobacter sp. AP-Nino-20-G2]
MKPVLYTYRRCPYAMRARMALKYAGIEVEYREIVLRDKPRSLLSASPKGTVPVLCADGLVLDQSLDIMFWALERADPDGWRFVDQSIADGWIQKNDGPFKKLLDQYKYPNRYPDLNQEEVLRDVVDLMLQPLELALQVSPYVMGNQLSWVDIAIFPFIRQFAAVNPQRFGEMPYPAIKKWLEQRIASELFHSVMDKHPSWID